MSSMLRGTLQDPRTLTEAASFGKSHNSGSGSGSGTGKKDFIRYYPVYTLPPYRPYNPLTHAPYIPTYTHYETSSTDISAWSVIRILLVIVAFVFGLMRCHYYSQQRQERERAARELAAAHDEANRTAFAAIVASPSKPHTAARASTTATIN